MYCPPTGVTLRNEAAVVAKYLKDNPDKLKQPAQLLVVKALGLTIRVPVRFRLPI